MQVYTGQYVGDDNPTQAITGVGFAPDVVMVESFVGGFSWLVVRGSNWPATISSKFGGGGSGNSSSQGIISLDADGFTVGTDINNSAVTAYCYICLSADPTCLANGYYNGDGTEQRSIPTGFDSDLIFMLHNDALSKTRWWFYFLANGYGNDASLSPSGNDAFPDSGSFDFTSGGPTDFVVNSPYNTSGKTYYWVALAGSPSFVPHYYNGNGADNRNISLTDKFANTYPNFVTKFVMVRKYFSFGTLAVGSPIKSDAAVYAGDISGTLGSAEGFSADKIQALNVGGFQVGTHTRVNANSDTYGYFAFGDPGVATTTTTSTTSSTSSTTTSTSSTSSSTSSTTTSTSSFSSTTSTSSFTSSSSFTSRLMSFNEVDNEHLIGDTPYFWFQLPHMYRDVSDKTIR